MSGVLGVHGIWNHHPGQPPATAAAMIAAVWGGSLGTPVDIAYYAHHLHRGTPQGDQDDPDALPAGAREMFVDWVDGLRTNRTVAQGSKTVRARQAADWLTRHFGDALRISAIVFFREAHTYLGAPDAPRRLAARAAVLDAIRAHRPDVIIGHSLGSVVTYETLWHHDVEVDLLVTLGSPLAMPGVVRPRLCPDTHGRPPGVRRWVNIADVGDPFAVPRGGLAPWFDGVDADVMVTIGDWVFHSIEPYLGCAEVRAAILG